MSTSVLETRGRWLVQNLMNEEPLPGEGVVEDEHVDAWCADLELALDVLLVGIASGGGNEDLGGRQIRKTIRG